MFSGLSALAFEVLWTRMLTLVFGGTALAVVSVLCAYMAGLALGSVVAGRLSARIHRPVRLYGALELLIGVWALLLPFASGTLPLLHRWLALELSPFALALVRFCFALALLLPPTALMGATLPILSQYFTRSRAHVGRDVGLLYTANTFGAVLGCFLSGFILLPTLGLRTSLVLIACINLSIGILMLCLPFPPAPVPQLPPTPKTTHERLALRSTFLLGVFGLTGMLAMLCQVSWSRALAMLIGSSVYAFTLILSTFLLGLALGSWLGSWLADRFRQAFFALGAILLLIGVSLWLGLLFLDRIPLLFYALARETALTPTTLFAIKLLLCALLILPPTSLMGMLFPLLIRNAFIAQDSIARLVGLTYATNTLGAIGGSFCAGFVFIPLLGLQGALTFCVIAYALCAFGCLLLSHTAPWRKGSVAFCALCCALCVLPLTPSWNRSRLSLGLFRIAHLKRIKATHFTHPPPIKYYKEGLHTTVTVEQYGVHLALKVNGKTDASTASDMPTQILVGVLPMLLRPKARKVAMIGWGSGVSAGAVLRFPIKRLDAIELEPAVVTASRLFARWNHKPWQDPRLHMHHDDGRNFLATSPRRFDVLISEPSNPWLSGVSALFTVEFFRLAHARLAKDGLLCQWIQLYELSPQSIRSLLRSVSQVFPHVALFGVSHQSHDTVLLASRRPLRISPPTLQASFRQPRVAQELLRAGIRAPIDLLPRLIADDQAIRSLAKGVPSNTDDNALIEVRAPIELLTHVGHHGKRGLLRLLAKRANRFRKVFTHTPTAKQPEQHAHFLAMLALAHLRYGHPKRATTTLQRAGSTYPTSPAVRLAQRIHSTLRDTHAALEACLRTKDTNNAKPPCKRVFGSLPLARSSVQRQLKLPKTNPKRLLLEGFLYYRYQKWEESLDRLARLIPHTQFLQAHPGIYYLLGQLYKRKRIWPEAVWFTRLYIQHDTTRP